MYHKGLKNVYSLIKDYEKYISYEKELKKVTTQLKLCFSAKSFFSGYIWVGGNFEGCFDRKLGLQDYILNSAFEGGSL